MELHVSHDFELHCMMSAMQEFAQLRESGEKISFRDHSRAKVWFDQIHQTWMRACSCGHCPQETEVPGEVVMGFLSLQAVRRMGTHPLAPLMARIDERRVKKVEEQKKEEIKLIEQSMNQEVPEGFWDQLGKS